MYVCIHLCLYKHVYISTYLCAHTGNITNSLPHISEWLILMSLTDATHIEFILMHGCKGQFKILSEFWSCFSSHFFKICSLSHFILFLCWHVWETFTSNQTELEIAASDFTKNIFKDGNLYSMLLWTKSKILRFYFKNTHKVSR